MENIMDKVRRVMDNKTITRDTLLRAIGIHYAYANPIGISEVFTNKGWQVENYNREEEMESIDVLAAKLNSLPKEVRMVSLMLRDEFGTVRYPDFSMKELGRRA